MSESTRRKVVIFQTKLVHYRVSFFDRLREAAEERGIDLHLVHGSASAKDGGRQDEGPVAWATDTPTSRCSIGGVELVWHRTPVHLRDADQVILMQENRVLSNYPYLARRWMGGPLVAFWGHGANLQSTAPQGPREIWKRFLRDKVDYWFAYTDLTARFLAEVGYPAERISIVQNSIDVKQFQSQCARATDDEVRQLRLGFGIAADARVGIFCGSLYPEKRLDLLFAAADLVKRRVSNFHLILVGSGPSLNKVQAAVEGRPWAHLAGVQKGAKKAILFKTADVLLNPGAVGLGVLDGFSAGLPIVTTRDARHGPEFTYIVHGTNGIITDGTPEEYAAAVSLLLENEAYRAAISRGAQAAAEEYSVERMAMNFIQGIERCFELGRLKPSIFHGQIPGAPPPLRRAD